MPVRRRHDAMHLWERLEYPVRLAWYRSKLAFGIEPISDKNFLPHDFAMRLIGKRLPHVSRFTIGGRTDGIGMQAMARLSGLLFAHVYGATYIDTPFSAVGHITEKGLDTLADWEALFNFGRHELAVSDDASNILEYADYIARRAQLRSNSVFRFQQMYWLYRRHPDLLDRNVAIFQAKYHWPERGSGDPLQVAVHIRRGDVGKTQNAMRYTSDDRILTSIRLLETVLKDLHIQYRVTVHSQGDPADFMAYSAQGYALNLEENAIIAMRHLIESDVLIMAKSSFSYLAAIYNRGIKLYEPTFNPCLPSWIARKPSGSFDLARFRKVVRARIIAASI